MNYGDQGKKNPQNRFKVRQAVSIFCVMMAKFKATKAGSKVNRQTLRRLGGNICERAWDLDKKSGGGREGMKPPECRHKRSIHVEHGKIQGICLSRHRNQFSRPWVTGLLFSLCLFFLGFYSSQLTVRHTQLRLLFRSCASKQLHTHTRANS